MPEKPEVITVAKKLSLKLIGREITNVKVLWDNIIEGITRDIEVDGIYTGKVSRIVTFGAFIDLGNGKEGLLHISKISKERVNKVEDVLKVGQEVTVKVFEIDSQGRINLTRKDLYMSEE